MRASGPSSSRVGRLFPTQVGHRPARVVIPRADVQRRPALTAVRLRPSWGAKLMHGVPRLGLDNSVPSP